MNAKDLRNKVSNRLGSADDENEEEEEVEARGRKKG